jgi:U1 small nuclear ribonucleoprotein
MGRFFPPNLLWFFQARCQLKYLPPQDHPPEDRKTRYVTGVAAYLDELRNPKMTYVPSESPLQREDRFQLEKQEAREKRLEEALERCKFVHTKNHDFVGG